MTAPVPCPLGCCSAGQLSVLQGRGFLSSSHSAAHSRAGKKHTQVITRLQKAATELRVRVLSWAAATGVPQTPALILHAGKLLSSVAPQQAPAPRQPCLTQQVTSLWRSPVSTVTHGEAR